MKSFQAQEVHDFHSDVQKGDISRVKDKIALVNKDVTQEANPKSGDRAVHLAARHGHRDILELLLEKGVDLEIANLDGKRALHEAVAMGHTLCVDYLLMKGVDVDPLKRADW